MLIEHEKKKAILCLNVALKIWLQTWSDHKTLCSSCEGIPTLLIFLLTPK